MKSMPAITLFFVLTIALFLTPQVVPAQQKVTVALGSGVFQQKGGDPCTQSAGSPFVAQNVFDTFFGLDADQNFIPSLAVNTGEE